MTTNTPERKITLGGKTYPVRLTFGVLAKAESRSGSNFMQPATWKPLKATDVLALIWAVTGARETGPLSYETLADTLVPSMELYEIHSVFISAWLDAFTGGNIDEDGDGAPLAQATEGGGPERELTSASAAPSSARSSAAPCCSRW